MWTAAAPQSGARLLAQDQLIPSGALLGFANADHWSVALRLEDRFPILAHRRIGKHPFPQSVLLESALRFVRGDLGVAAPAAAAATAAYSYTRAVRTRRSR